MDLSRFSYTSQRPIPGAEAMIKKDREAFTRCSGDNNFADSRPAKSELLHFTHKGREPAKLLPAALQQVRHRQFTEALKCVP